MLIIIPALLIILILLAWEFQLVAVEKGYESMKYFWYCLLFTIAGYLLVIALPCRQKNGADGAAGDQEASMTWTCTNCGTKNKLGKTKCSSCGKS